MSSNTDVTDNLQSLASRHCQRAIVKYNFVITLVCNMTTFKTFSRVKHLDYLMHYLF